LWNTSSKGDEVPRTFFKKHLTTSSRDKKPLRRPPTLDFSKNKKIIFLNPPGEKSNCPKNSFQ